MRNVPLRAKLKSANLNQFSVLQGKQNTRYEQKLFLIYAFLTFLINNKNYRVLCEHTILPFFICLS